MGSRGEMLDSGYILKVEPIEFTDGLYMGNERGELRDDFEVFSLKKMKLLFIERGTSQKEQVLLVVLVLVFVMR